MGSDRENPKAFSSDASASELPGCDGNTMSLGAYFFEGRRVRERCQRPIMFRVKVNPPRPGNDGTVYLCNFCNRWDYSMFPRIPFPDGPKGQDETVQPSRDDQ